jgi:ribosome biogenesis GTPase
VAVAPRRSALSRDVAEGGRHRDHVLAANIDQAVVVCSPAEPPFRPRLIDRYLVAACRDALPAVICLNKTDLGVPDNTEASLRGYTGLGVEVLRTSAVTGDGIDALRRCVQGNVSLFTGHSGVGKSSVLNALEPGLALRIGSVTQSTAGQGKGRHTTSSARLVPLSLPETFVVDTPGIRTFSLRGTDQRRLAGYFADIAALVDGCEFRDCLHRGEPGCAVAAAAESDPFLRGRLRSYRRMLRELG